MALPGERDNSNSFTCGDCGVLMRNQVLHSAAGYYVGKACKCGPYSRVSSYYPTREEAAVRVYMYR